jgi:hypothetical protein
MTSSSDQTPATRGLFAPLAVDRRVGSLVSVSRVAAIDGGFPAVMARLSVTEAVRSKGVVNNAQPRVRCVIISGDSAVYGTDPRPRGKITCHRTYSVCRWRLSRTTTPTTLNTVDTSGSHRCNRAASTDWTGCRSRSPRAQCHEQPTDDAVRRRGGRRETN